MAEAAAAQTTDTKASRGKLPSRPAVEQISVEAWLLRLATSDPDLIEDKDFRHISTLAPGPIATQCVERFLPLIWNKVLHPGQKPQRDRSGVRASGEIEFQAFVNLLWARYSKMTGRQARSEAGALVAIFANVKPRQLVSNAMTREQFAEQMTAHRAKEQSDGKGN